MKGGFDYNNLDRQIADMFKCKPLPELEVKALCEKVITQFILGQRNLNIISKCCSSKSTCSCLWRYSWTIPRFNGTL